MTLRCYPCISTSQLRGVESSVPRESDLCFVTPVQTWVHPAFCARLDSCFRRNDGSFNPRNAEFLDPGFAGVTT